MSIDNTEDSKTDRPYTERPNNEPSQVTDTSQDFTARTDHESKDFEPSENYPNENLDPVNSINGPLFHRKNHQTSKNSNYFGIERGDSINSDSSKTSFLPEINRSGSLVSQDLNYNRISSAQSGRSSASSIRSYNAIQQDSIEIMSIDGECLTPKPPDTERPSSSKSRTVTPLNR